MTERSDFYVYCLYDPADRLLEHPRYIGKGWGMRVVAHRTKRSARVTEWIKSELHGEEPFFDIIAANLTEAAAYALEIELIAKYGREGIDEGGKLLNVSTGGPGARGVKRSPEAIEKTTAALRAANIGRKHSDETRARMSAAQKGRKHSPESIERSASAHRGRKRSDETRAKMKKSPEQCAAISAALRGKPKSPDAVAKTAAANRARWAAMSPEELRQNRDSLGRMTAATQ